MGPLRLFSVEESCHRFSQKSIQIRRDSDPITALKDISRFNFFAGAAISFLEAIYSTALSALSLIASICSFFQWDASVDWLQAGGKDVGILLKTFFLCLLGTAIPGTINDYLHLPLTSSPTHAK